MRFRPCIDLHGGKVKQIVGQTLTEGKISGPQTNFETDRPASHFASLYRGDGLRGGHVIMLGPGNEAAALSALRAWPGGLQAGGGISPGNACRFLDAGASHVIVTSYVFGRGKILWYRLASMKKKTGKQRLVVDVSCQKRGGSYLIAANRWQTLTDVPVSAENLEKLARYCDEFLVHAVEVEGKRQGIDAELVCLMADASPVPATYAGGIRSIDDLEAVRTAGRNRIDATVGSALDIFGGSLRYTEVVAWHRRQERSSRIE
jgi:phosphoribosylformimino-5-aminoimidazole carboxamide ribotide isomerase